MRLHVLVDRLATLQRPALLWALVVMAEEMLNDVGPRPRYTFGFLCTLGCLALML